jgi:hypothetical protein
MEEQRKNLSLIKLVKEILKQWEAQAHYFKRGSSKQGALWDLT